MIKSACDIENLSCESENEVKGRVPGATLILVLDDEGNVTPISINTGEGSETKIIDREAAELKAKNSSFRKLSTSLTFSFGTGSGWCTVDGGGGFLVYNYKP